MDESSLSNPNTGFLFGIVAKSSKTERKTSRQKRFFGETFENSNSSMRNLADDNRRKRLTAFVVAVFAEKNGEHDGGGDSRSAENIKRDFVAFCRTIINFRHIIVGD